MNLRTALPRALAVPLLTLALAAGAAPVYLIDATTDGQAPDPSLSNVGFSLTYEDFDFNQLFSLSELLAFTGYTDGMGNYLSELVSVPTAPGILGNGTGWQLSDGQTTVSFAPETFTAFTQGAGQLPVPGSAILAGLGPAALTAVSRRRVVSWFVRGASCRCRDSVGWEGARIS